MPTYKFGCNGESHNFDSWDELVRASGTLCPAPLVTLSIEYGRESVQPWIQINT